ncbi:MAG: diguanylate cyclase [Helicobacteraceae bacterium]|nr:diguanylate cyclase [Helicobacteraceae bacterium]
MNFKIKMLIPITAAFVTFAAIVSYAHYAILKQTVEEKTNEDLDMFINGMSAGINNLNTILAFTKRILSEKHIAIAKSIAQTLNNSPTELTPEQLRRIAEPLDIIEISISGKDGIMTNSSVPKYIGFDYKAHKNTAKYMALAEGKLSELSEEPRESEFDDDTPGEINHYVGIAHKGGFIQIGFHAAMVGILQDEINIQRTIKKARIGNNGYGMVLSRGAIVAHPNENLLGRDVSGESWYQGVSSGEGFVWTEIDGARYYAKYKNVATYKNADNVTILALVPESDYYMGLNNLKIVTLWLLVSVIAIMVVVVYFILSGLLRPLREISAAALNCADGKFGTEISLHSTDELGVLADSFRHLARTFDGIITDIEAMTKNHFEGDYEYLIETEGYKGRYKDMATGINAMMLMTVDELKTIIDYLKSLKFGGQIGKIKRFPGKKAIISDTIDELVGRVQFDILTGIYNRRYMEATLNNFIKTMQRSGGTNLSVLMMDVDFFKKYNDTYGHAEGDNCLRAVAKAIESSLQRDDDFVARYGGEEFAVVLPNTDKNGARIIAERALENVRKRNIPHEKNEAASCVTLSIGVATGDVKIMQNAMDYIKLADKALYISKENGRNRITFYDDESV